MNIVDTLYRYLYDLAEEKGLHQTLVVLPYAREKHEGMYRKGKTRHPYIIHPMTMARHAVALGLVEDDLLAVTLLHDVCEDCGVLVEELPVNDKVKHSVHLLTKKEGFNKKTDNQEYYHEISKDRNASVAKILDRCNNISCMSDGFYLAKMERYAKETEAYLIPLIDHTIENFPELTQQMFLLRYHLDSVISTVHDIIQDHME